MDKNISDEEMREIEFSANSEAINLRAEEQAEDIIDGIDFISEDDREYLRDTLITLFRLDGLSESMIESLDSQVKDLKEANDAMRTIIRLIKPFAPTLIQNQLKSFQ